MSQRLLLLAEGIRTAFTRAVGGFDSKYLHALKGLSTNASKRVCFVCRGNICRSPYAAVKLRMMLGKETGSLIDIFSAGLDTTPGKPANPQAIKVSAEYGVSLSEHRTQRATAAELSTCDLVVAMDRMHLDWLKELDPSLLEKTLLLGSLDPTITEGVIIPDPYGHPDDEFRRCYTRIDRALAKLVKDHLTRPRGEMDIMQPSEG